MKKTITFTVFYALLLVGFLCPFAVSAQTPFDQLLKIAEEDFLAERYDSAIVHYQQAQILAVNGSEKQALANLGLAKCWLDLWDYPKAFPLLRSIEGIKKVNKTIKGDIYIAIARAYSTELKADSALIYLDLAYKTWKNFPDAEREINWRNEKARSYNRLMQFKESIKILEEGKKTFLLKKLSISANTTARFWGTIADCYEYFGWSIKHKDALEKFNNAMNDVPFGTIAWSKIALNWGLYFSSFPEKYYIEDKGLNQFKNTSELSRIDSINITIESIFNSNFADNSLQNVFVRMLLYKKCHTDDKNIIEQYFGKNSLTTAFQLRREARFQTGYKKINSLKEANEIFKIYQKSNVRSFLNVLDLLTWEYSAMNNCDSLKFYHDQIISLCNKNNLEIEYALYLTYELSSPCFNYKYGIGKTSGIEALEKAELLLIKNVGDSSLIYGDFREQKPNQLVNIAKIDFLAERYDSAFAHYQLAEIGDICVEGVWIPAHKYIALMKEKEEREPNYVIFDSLSNYSAEDIFRMSTGYYHGGNFDKYKQLLFESLKNRKKVNDKTEMKILDFVCQYYLEVGMCDSAQYFYNILSNHIMMMDTTEEKEILEKYNYAETQIMPIGENLGTVRPFIPFIGNFKESLGYKYRSSILSNLRNKLDVCNGLNLNTLPQVLRNLIYESKDNFSLTYSPLNIQSIILALIKNGLLTDKDTIINELINVQVDQESRNWDFGNIPYEEPYTSEEDSLIFMRIDSVKLNYFKNFAYELFAPEDTTIKRCILTFLLKTMKIREEVLNAPMFSHTEPKLVEILFALKEWNIAIYTLRQIFFNNFSKYNGDNDWLTRSNNLKNYYIYSDLGYVYLNLNYLSRATTCYSKILSDIDRISGLKSSKAELLGDCLPWLLQKKDFPLAISTLQKAISLVNGHQQGSFEPDKVAGKETILPALYAKLAKAYNVWYAQDPKDALLDSALLYSGYAMQTFGLVCDFSDTYDPTQNLDILNGENKQYFEEAIRIRLTHAKVKGKQATLKESFVICERCKATQMRQMLWNFQALKSGKVKPALLEMEKANRRQIDAVEQTRFQLLQRGAPATTHTDLTNRLEKLRKERKAILQQIKTQDPEAYRRRYENNVVSVDTIQQKLLAPNQTLLEYYLTDSLLVIFVVRKDTFYLLTKVLRPDFKAQVKYMVEQLNKRETDVKKDSLYRVSYLLYLDLLEDVVKNPPAKTETETEFIIVPDGVLSLLPFEALLMEDPKKSREHQWLIRKHPVSYAVSATVLYEMKSRPLQQYEKEYLGIAPVYQGLDTSEVAKMWKTSPHPDSTRRRGDFSDLEHNQPEVAAISIPFAPLTSISLYDKEATRDNFIKYAVLSRIIHFGGHAKGYEDTGDYSFLTFTYHPGDPTDKIRLFAKDIYGLSIKADMVVLSGCQTGLGRLNNGEGVIGLGRAFASAGAKSLVLSLWSVDDESTKDLMVSFYKHLMEGKTKNKALREAKLELIKAGKSPLFWAPFVQYGDTSPIFSPN